MSNWRERIKDIADTQFFDRAQDYVWDHRNDFTDADGIWINEQQVAEAVIEALVSKEGLTDDTEIEEFYEAVQSAIPDDTWSALRQDLSESMADAVAYRRDPLGYYGMRERDFM